MFKKEAKIVFIIMGMPLFIGILALIIAPKLMGAPCDSEIIITYDSPKVNYKVIVFKRNCSIPESAYTHVSVVDKTDEFKGDEGNLFIVELGEAEKPKLGQLRIPIDIYLFEKDSFIIRYPKDAKVIMKKSNVNEVNVKYRTR
jgi:hypothetical protein